MFSEKTITHPCLNQSWSDPIHLEKYLAIPSRSSASNYWVHPLPNISKFKFKAVSPWPFPTLPCSCVALRGSSCAARSGRSPQRCDGHGNSVPGESHRQRRAWEHPRLAVSLKSRKIRKYLRIYTYIIRISFIVTIEIIENHIHIIYINIDNITPTTE